MGIVQRLELPTFQEELEIWALSVKGLLQRKEQSLAQWLEDRLMRCPSALQGIQMELTHKKFMVHRVIEF